MQHNISVQAKSILLEQLITQAPVVTVFPWPGGNAKALTLTGREVKWFLVFAGKLMGKVSVRRVREQALETVARQARGAHSCRVTPGTGRSAQAGPNRCPGRKRYRHGK